MNLNKAIATFTSLHIKVAETMIWKAYLEHNLRLIL